MKDPRLAKADCDNCPIECKIPVWPQWNRNSKAIILGEAPSAIEVHNQEVLLHHAGQRCEAALARGGAHRSEFHITNTLLCRPDRKLTPTEWRKAIICCRPRLHWELKHVDSSSIIALGGKALQTTTKKSSVFDWCAAPISGVAWEKFKPRAKKKQKKGVLVDFSKYTVYSTFHPAFCLRNPAYLPIFYRHISWFLKLIEGEPAGTWPEMHVDVSPAMLAALNRILADGQPVGVDLEVNPSQNDLIMCVGLANRNVAVSVPWETYLGAKNELSEGVVDLAPQDQLARETRDVTLQILRSQLPKVYQNGPYDTFVIQKRLGFEPPNFTFDTLPAHSLVAGRLRHDLGFIAACEGTWPRWKSEFRTKDLKGAAKFVKRPPHLLRVYNAKDSWLPVEVQDSLEDQIEKLGLSDVFRQRMEVMNVTCKMTYHGIKTDPAAREAHRAPLEAVIKKKLRWLRRLSGNPEFNPDSTTHLRQLFVDVLKLVPRYWTEKGAPCFDKNALEAYMGGDLMVDLACRTIKDFREKSKLLNTYVNKLPVDNDHVLHPYWRPFQRTGRWSATPGIQTIPPVLRNIFVSRHKRLAIADWSQQELRILALFSGDEKLMDAYSRNEDIHSFVTSIIHNRKPDDSKEFKALRKPIKSFNFGVAYGASLETVYQNLLVQIPSTTYDSVKWMYDRYFEMFSGVATYQTNWIKRCEKLGYVENPISGLKQFYMDGIIDPSECLNFPIQSEGARMCNEAILGIAKELDWGPESIVIQCHDEIVLDGPDEKRLLELLHDHMEQTTRFEGREMFFTVDSCTHPCWTK